MCHVQTEKILHDLVTIPSVTSDLEANTRVLDYSHEFLSEHGMYIERREHEGYGSLVATSQPTKTPKVMLVAHTDVVPAPKELFHVREAEGKLFGRGVFDMKGAIAAYLALTAELGNDLRKYDFGITLVSNEEVGGLGVKHLLDEGFVPSVAVLPDGGRDWCLETVAKGAWSVTLDATGQQAHGSRPWEGDSASFKLLDVLNEIRPLFEGQGLSTDTLNISLLSGGVAQNQVPALASATLDIRVMNQASYQRVKQQVTEICRRHGIDPRVIAFFPPMEHDMNDPYIKQFAQSIETVTGGSHKGVVSTGSCDAVYYHERNVPCVVTRPPGGGAHGDDEWVDKAAFRQLAPVLGHYIAKVCAATA